MIVILDGYALNPGDISWAEVEALGEVKIYDRTPAEETAARIGAAKYVFTNKTAIPPAVLDKCPNIKFIGVLATGYNTIDVQACKARGITVCNVPAYSTDSVAQFVFALLLEICSCVGTHNAAVKAGAWVDSKDFSFTISSLIELRGKTLGIIGFGQIGQAVYKIAIAFGMKVLAYNGARKPIAENKDFRYAELDEIYAGADIITLHCPLFDTTKGIINKDSIAKMKDGVILINTSRGGLVVEQDLADALNTGKIYAAACDVASTEPPAADNPLLSAKNIYLTPHIAWAPVESRKRLISIAANNLRCFLGGSPINVVK